jgi:hypothetical protein
MVSSGINYRETYFEFPELTKLQGEPNSESLFKLRNELKANAQSVYSNLSDGAHGHLALVLSDPQYALITAQPFIRPVHPGQLIIPAGTTGPMSTVMKEAHQESIRLFREVEGVEKALVQQIVQAVAAPYLSSIRDRATNSLRGTVYQILDFLQTNYGRVSPQMLEDREQELRNMNYNTQHPIDTVFNAVEDFVDLAEMGLQPLTQSQTIAKAYVIINKTRRYKNDIVAWNRRPIADKTWVNFKQHFRQAHREFRETTDITLEDSELQRNNAHLVQQVVDGMQQAMAQDDGNSELIQQMTNSAAIATATQTQLQQQIQQMQQSMSLLQAQVASNQQPRSHGYQGQNNRGRGGYQGRGGRGNNNRRNTSLYCWSHGGAGHTSADCNTKLAGHQDAATFQNKMGGSTRNCTA